MTQDSQYQLPSEKVVELRSRLADSPDIRRSFSNHLLSLSGSSKNAGFEEATRLPLYWQSYPSLSIREVGRWAEMFGVHPIHAQRVSDPMRTEQATIRLRTRGRDLAMKIYLADEIRVTLLGRIFGMLDRCRHAGFPCPEPLQRKQDSYLFVDGQFAIGLYDWLDGDNLLHTQANTVQKMTAEQARSAGMLLAHWHLLVDRLLPQEGSYSMNDCIAAICLSHDKWVKQVNPATQDPEIAKIIHRLSTDAAWFELIGSLAPLPLQWIHGDATVRNFMFDGDEAIALIDFDMAEAAPRLFDLIILLQAQPEFMLQMLDGYQGVSALSSAEKRALPVLAGGRLLKRLLERMSAGNGAMGRLPVVYAAYREMKYRLRAISSHL